MVIFFFFQAEDGIRDVERSRGLGDVYKRQLDYRGSIYEVDGIYSEPDADGNHKKIDVKVSVADGTGNMSAETSSRP